MLPKPKKRLLYLGLLGALISKAFALGVAIVVVYSFFAFEDQAMSLELRIGFAAIFVGVAIFIVLFTNSPAKYFRDMRLREPAMTTGDVHEVEEREVGVNSFDSSSTSHCYVVLTDGQRFKIRSAGYRKLEAGDHICISYYPNTGVVTEIEKLASV